MTNEIHVMVARSDLDRATRQIAEGAELLSHALAVNSRLQEALELAAAHAREVVGLVERLHAHFQSLRGWLVASATLNVGLGLLLWSVWP